MLHDQFGFKEGLANGGAKDQRRSTAGLAARPVLLRIRVLAEGARPCRRAPWRGGHARRTWLGPINHATLKKGHNESE